MEQQIKELLNKLNVNVISDPISKIEVQISKNPEVLKLLNFDFSKQNIKHRHISTAQTTYELISLCYQVALILGDDIDFEKVFKVWDTYFPNFKIYYDTLINFKIDFIQPNIKTYLSEVKTASVILDDSELSIYMISNLIKHNLCKELFNLNTKIQTDEILTEFMINSCDLKYKSDKDFLLQTFSKNRNFTNAIKTLLEFRKVYPTQPCNKWLNYIRPEFVYALKDCPYLIQTQYANKMYKFVADSGYWYALNRLVNIEEVFTSYVKTPADLDELERKLFNHYAPKEISSINELRSNQFTHYNSRDKICDVYRNNLIKIAKSRNTPIDDCDLYDKLSKSFQPYSEIKTNVGLLDMWTCLLVKLNEFIINDPTSYHKFIYLDSIGQVEQAIVKTLCLDNILVFNRRNTQILALNKMLR